MDEEEDSLDQGILGAALDAYGTTSPEGQQEALRILQRYNDSVEDNVEPEREILDKMQKSADQVRGALQRARERVLNQRYNPGEALLAVSSALARPNANNIGTIFGNVSEALRGPLANKNQFNRDRDQSLLELDTAEAGVDAGVQQAEFSLEKLKRQLDAQLAGKSLTALRGSSRTGRTPRPAEWQMRLASTTRQLIDLGMDPAEAYDRASNITFGNEKLEILDELGVARLTNLVTKEVEEIPTRPRTPVGTPRPTPAPNAAGAQADPANPANVVAETPTPPDPRDNTMPEEMTLYDAANLGTGLWSTIREGWSTVAGNVGLPIAEETAKARQSLLNQAERIQRALSVDPRDPAVREIERIREAFKLLPSVGNNPDLFRSRLSEIRTMLVSEQNKAIADNQDTAQSMPYRQMRGELAATIRNILPLIGEPPPGSRSAAASAPPPPDLEEKYKAIWPYLTPEKQTRLAELAKKKREAANGP